MSNERRTVVRVDAGVTGAGEDGSPGARPDDVMILLREQFAAQHERVPPDPQLLALARVATGFVRTSPVPGASSTDGQRIAARAFVLAACGWWTSDAARYGRLASLIDDAFHQREVPLPDPGAREMLGAVADGLLRQRGVGPLANGAQLAVVDWLTALYLAGAGEW